MRKKLIFVLFVLFGFMEGFADHGCPNPTVKQVPNIPAYRYWYVCNGVRSSLVYTSEINAINAAKNKYSSWLQSEEGQDYIKEQERIAYVNEHCTHFALTDNSGCLSRPILLISGFEKSIDKTWNVEEIEGDYNEIDNLPVIDAIMEKYYIGEHPLEGNNNTGLEFFETHTNDFGTSALYDNIEVVLNQYYGAAWKNDPDLQIDLITKSTGGLLLRQTIASYRSSDLSNPVNHIRSIIFANVPHDGLTYVESGIEVLAELKSKGNIAENALNLFAGSPGFQNFLMERFDYNQILDLSSSASLLLNINIYPTIPRTGHKIPAVSLYSTADNFGKHVYNYMKMYKSEVCDKEDDYSGKIKCGGPFYKRWSCRVGRVALGGVERAFRFGTDLVTSVGVTAYNLADDFSLDAFEWSDQSIATAIQKTCEVYKDIMNSPADLSYNVFLKKFDEQWAHQSDLFTSVSSQKGSNVFSEDNDPYRTIKVIPTGTEQNVMIYKILGARGVESYGSYYLQAIDELDIIHTEYNHFNIVPTIIVPLLLN